MESGSVLTRACCSLCSRFTPEKLRSYFGAYGTVTDAVVMKDPVSRRSRGFGFITYADPTCVDRALAQPNHILDSRRVCYGLLCNAAGVSVYCALFLSSESLAIGGGQTSGASGGKQSREQQ